MLIAGLNKDSSGSILIVMIQDGLLPGAPRNVVHNEIMSMYIYLADRCSVSGYQEIAWKYGGYTASADSTRAGHGPLRTPPASLVGPI